MFRIFSLLLTCLFLSNSALASVTINCASNDVPFDDRNNGVDYGNAPSSYGLACHDTDEWQKLGNNWDTESAGQSSDSSNDGVAWKTSSDGGATWTDEWSATGELTQGDKVKFKFDVTRSTTGGHEYDELKAWVDWNVNGDSADDRHFDLNEEITFDKWYLNEDEFGNVNSNTTTENRSLFEAALAAENIIAPGRNLNIHEYNWFKSENYDLYQSINPFNNSDTLRSYVHEMTIPLTAALGETWLRARVICNNSLTDFGLDSLMATGWYHQGEVEDYKLNIVAKKTVVEVPEPTSLLLFAVGLFAIASRRKKLNVK